MSPYTESAFARTGVLMRSIERDERLDSAMVTLMVTAQDRMLTILTPPQAIPQHPLTLALLQASPSCTQAMLQASCSLPLPQ